MSKLPKTPQEFIQSAFSPSVAVLSSPKVDNVVSKNNLSFVELLQPFTSLDWEGQFREPTGSWCTVKNLKLNVRDVNWKPLQPTEARKQLNNAVITNYHDKKVLFELGSRKFEIPQSTVWFDAWRETYFEVQFPSDHEYTKHFLSCMLVGTSQDDNIVDIFNSLLQQLVILQNVVPPKLPKWFNNDILKTFVLLHDPSTGNNEKVSAMFEAMQQTFGSNNCFMLTINSRGQTDSDPISDLWEPFIKRSETHNDLLSPQNTVAASPIEPVYPSPSTTSPVSTQEEFATVLPEGQHPLTASESDIYDNANSLQNNSLTGSIESIGMDRKVSDATSELHGAALAAADVDALKQFLKDFATKALMPYFERQISLLTDVVANRKGVSRSLLSATKRWFGTGKGATTANSVIYSNDCPELQLRRLGDLWFMCGQWQRAFDTYHTAKREFYADAAWLCYAGALEMAAISAFMAGDATRKTHAYIEESITTYLNTCRMVQYAVRATLLSVLCLNNAGTHGEAAKQLIRMTSEDSDLRSAMLLEQAALAFLCGPGPKAMARKYSFHMVLAGHRFSKAGQKKHAYRCYQQAYQIYKDSGWRLSTDHVQFALGRLAGSLRDCVEAARWLSGPLQPNSPQPPDQQHSFLREYMRQHQQWIDMSGDKSSLSILPLPLVSGESIAVLSAGTPPLTSPRRVPATSLALSQPPEPQKPWHRMEEMLLQVAQGGVPMIFKPTINLHNSATDNSRSPVVPQGEPVQISVTVSNPLKIPLTMIDVELLWKFNPSPSCEVVKQPIRNEPSIALNSQLKTNIISGQKIKTITLEGESEKNIVLSITPLYVGELHLQGISYKLCNGGTEEHDNRIIVSGKQILEIPKKLKCNNKDEDRRLQINVIPSAPCLQPLEHSVLDLHCWRWAFQNIYLENLAYTRHAGQTAWQGYDVNLLTIPQMTFSEIATEVVCGELLTFDVEFRNAGPVELTNLFLCVSHPDTISLASEHDQLDDFQTLYEEKYQQPPDNMEERAIRAAAWRSRCGRAVRGVAARLAGGAAVRRGLRLRAAGSALRLLAYYDGPGAPHRLLRHTFRFHVSDVVKVSASPRRSLSVSAEGARESLSLAVRLQNRRPLRDCTSSLHLLEVSLLGRQWKLTDYMRSRANSEALSLHEKLHLVLRATRISPPEGVVEWSSLKINEKHPESLANINTPPYSKFVVDYSHKEDDLSQDKEKSEGLIQSTLVVRWKMHIVDKGESRTAIGQTYIWIECFSNPPAEVIKNEISLNFEENDDDIPQKGNQSKDDIVIFKMEHSQNVTHNFNRHKLCVVPVSVHFVNCYGVPVKAFMNMTTKRDGAEVGWAGSLSSVDGESGTAVSLGPFESRSVSLRAVVSAPGSYVLAADTTLSCQTDTIPPLTQLCNNSSVIFVRAAA